MSLTKKNILFHHSGLSFQVIVRVHFIGEYCGCCILLTLWTYSVSEHTITIYKRKISAIFDPFFDNFPIFLVPHWERLCLNLNLVNFACKTCEIIPATISILTNILIRPPTLKRFLSVRKFCLLSLAGHLYLVKLIVSIPLTSQS